MQHFADDNYDIEKAIARHDGLPFLLKKADLGVGRADLDPYTPEDQHFRPYPEPDSGPAAAAPPPPPGDPNCPYCQGVGCEYCKLSSCANCQGRGCENCLQDIYDRYNGNKYESKSKCECWEGYKRVPGTKPCAPGSCEKCDTHSKKSSDLNSQPFANPVPLADAPGTTPGNKPIDEVLESAPSAVGTGQTTSKTAYEYQRSVGPDAAPEPGKYHSPELDALEQRFNEWFETQPFPDEMRMSCLGSFDQAYEIARSNPNFEQLNPEAQFRALIEEVFRLIIGGKFNFNFPPTPNNNPILGKTAAAHTVEEKNNEFFVVEDGGKEAAGPFDSQDEAYARANELNDLENLETEETELKPSGGVSLTITMARTAAIKNSNFINEILVSYSQYPEFVQTVAQSLFHALRTTGQIADQILRSGANIDQIKNYIKPIFDKWNKGEIELDDIDQIVLGMNIFGEPNPILLGGENQQTIAKFASQGDKPSPHAAKAVFNALAGGNEDEAKELLKQTDCPNGCETHPEGKCNHGFMSAGRTRVRYLVSNEPFGKKDSDTESVE